MESVAFLDLQFGVNSASIKILLAFSVVGIIMTHQSFCRARRGRGLFYTRFDQCGHMLGTHGMNLTDQNKYLLAK